jgi:hypothetical protein
VSKKGKKISMMEVPPDRDWILWCMREQFFFALPDGSDLYGDALALCIFLDVAATDRIDAVCEEQPHNPTKKMMFKDTPNQI